MAPSPAFTNYHFASLSEDVAPDSKPHTLSPVDVIYKYCAYNLWLKRLVYDTALANHFVFTLRKVKAKLSYKEREVMQKILSVAHKSVADDMSVV